MHGYTPLWYLGCLVRDRVVLGLGRGALYARVGGGLQTLREGGREGERESDAERVRKRGREREREGGRERARAREREA